METTIVTEERRAEWNTFIEKHPYFTLLQAWEWGEFKEKSGWKPIRVAVESDSKILAAAQLLVKPLPLGLASLVYVPRGPIVDWTNDAVVQTLFSNMHNVAQQYRAISLKIEPATPYSALLEQQFLDHGFRPSEFNNHPRCSLLIDLTADPETLISRMGKTTRYNIRYSARKGVEVYKATRDDMDIYYELLEYNAEKCGVPARVKNHYVQEWEILNPHDYLEVFFARHEDEILAMRTPARFGTTTATFYSGFFDTAKRLKQSELLMWRCMEWAKSKGCTTYDVWGIPDEVGEHVYKGTPLPEVREGGLWGVYEFKRGFGGEPVYYIGTYDYVYSKPLHWSMNTAISMGSLDKLARLGDRLKF